VTDWIVSAALIKPEERTRHPLIRCRSNQNRDADIRTLDAVEDWLEAFDRERQRYCVTGRHRLPQRQQPGLRRRMLWLVP